MDDSGKAFPNSAPGVQNQEGLTKREWFAGMAMLGLLSNPNPGGNPEEEARYCFKLADAMLTVSEEETP